MDCYAGHDPTQLVTDYTRYSCPDCGGKNVFPPPPPPKKFTPMGDYIPPQFAKGLTPEQVERARMLLNMGTDQSWSLRCRAAFNLLREVVGDD